MIAALVQHRRLPERRPGSERFADTVGIGCNAHLSPPDTGLVAATYDSALEVFGKGLGRCPKQLWYDSRPETGGDAGRAEYGRRLERFARARGFAFRRTPGVGLLKTLDCAVREVKTPLLLFLEHDWMKEIRTLGFSRAHARWGTYLHGGMNAPARIEHLGE
jgi:hypothetical protein